MAQITQAQKFAVIVEKLHSRTASDKLDWTSDLENPGVHKTRIGALDYLVYSDGSEVIVKLSNDNGNIIYVIRHTTLSTVHAPIGYDGWHAFMLDFLTSIRNRASGDDDTLDEALRDLGA